MQQQQLALVHAQGIQGVSDWGSVAILLLSWRYAVQASKQASKHVRNDVMTHADVASKRRRAPQRRQLCLKLAVMVNLLQ